MYIKKQGILALVILSSAVQMAAKQKKDFGTVSIFQEMRESMELMNKHFDEMNQRMHQMQEELSESFSKNGLSSNVSLEEQEDGKALIISLKNITTHDIKTAVDHESKSIKINTDSAELKIKTDDSHYVPYLWIGLKQEHKKNANDKESTSLTNYTSNQRSISHPISIEKTEVQWNKKQNTITIILPYAIKEENNTVELPIKIIE